MLAPAALGLALMTGCMSNKSKPETVAQPAEPVFNQHCEYQPGVRAPEWYCNPEVPNGIAAIGEAKPNAARDNNMQRNMAMANGRDALAQQIQVKVQTMLTNWSRATGAGDDQTYEANFENVSRQTAQQTLNGSRQINRWVAPDGTLILLVGLTDTGELQKALKSNLNNEKALWQQFQSKQALDELDKQMEAAFN